MNLIRLLLLLLLILIIFFLYYRVDKELYTGYKKGRVDNIYNNIKKFNNNKIKKDKKKYSKILKLNNINIELPTDNYIINKNNDNTHIKSYIDNKIDDSKLVKKKNIRDDISHLYKKYKDDHHNKSSYFF